MADFTQFYNYNNFQWSLPGAENPRLSAPISSTATTVTVTNAMKDEDEAVITGDFLMGIKDSDGYTESCFVPSGTLAYDAQTANFTAGKILTGGTSGATAYIVSDSDSGTTGTLTLAFVSGTFQNDETITDNNSTPGSATSNGTLTNSVSADGLTISNVVRGIDLGGLDGTVQNTSTNAVDHDQDDPVTNQISAVHFTMMSAALQGTIASGGANWKIGRDKDENITIFAANGDTNEPAWRYNATLNTTGGWEYSDDGSTYQPFGDGSGLTASTGITISSGDIQADTSDTSTFVKTSSGAGDEDKVPVLNASGALADGFQNITAANATTLTDGSEAGALHTHEITAGTFEITLDATENNDTVITTNGTPTMIEMYIQASGVINDNAGYTVGDFSTNATLAYHGTTYKFGFDLTKGRTNTVNDYQDFNPPTYGSSTPTFGLTPVTNGHQFVISVSSVSGTDATIRVANTKTGSPSDGQVRVMYKIWT